MNSFLNLLAFEYKKILKRKSTYVILILMVLTTVIVCFGSLNSGNYWSCIGNNKSSYQAMKADKKIISSKKGVLDESLMKEAIKNNSIMISDDYNYFVNEYGKHLKPEAYIKYNLPYKNIIDLLNMVYQDNNVKVLQDGVKVFTMENVIDKLTTKDAETLYANLKTSTLQNISSKQNITDIEIKKHTKMLEKVTIPFENNYTDGYEKFLTAFNFIALALLISTSILIAPIFSNEFQTRTDQIMLSSKFGKNKVIKAKIITGLSLTFFFSTAITSLFLVEILTIFGIDGANVNIQILNPISTYPITMLQACFIVIAVVVLISMLFLMIIMLLSAKMKSSFGVIIISFLILFLPAFISITPKERFLYTIMQLIPIKAIEFSSIFSEYLFVFFNKCITPPVFYCGFSIIGIILIIPFTYKGFKNHQIG